MDWNELSDELDEWLEQDQTKDLQMNHERRTHDKSWMNPIRFEQRPNWEMTMAWSGLE